MTISIIFTLLHVFLLWLLEFAPYPELFVYPYLTASGFLPYKEILDQHFPGLMFFPINFFTLGFSTPDAFKALLLLIVIITSVLIYKITKSPLAVLLYALWQPFLEGNQLWLDVFLPLFTLPAFLLLRKKKVLLAGLSLGLGVVFKQTLIPLVAFVGLYTLFSFGLKKTLQFSIATLLPSIIMLIYLNQLGVLQDFWFWTVSFNLTAFAKGGSLYPRLADLLKLSLPITFICLAFLKRPRSRLPTLWLIFTLIGGIARFGFIHLQPGIPFFALGLSEYFKNSRYSLLTFLLLTTVWLGYFYSRQENYLQVKYFDSRIISLKNFIDSKTGKGDKVFLLGVDPHIYALTQTLPPNNMFIFQFPWFVKTVEPRLLSSLKEDPPKLIVYNPQSNIDRQYLKDYAAFLLEYISSSYQETNRVGDYLIYESRY